MQDLASQRQQAQKLFKENNFAEALELYKPLVLNPKNSGDQLSSDFGQVLACINQLNLVSEFDPFLEQAVVVHSNDGRLLFRAATALGRHEVAPWGFVIAGEFERGYHRGGGKQVSSAARDRVRAMQLVVQALPLLNQADDVKPTVLADAYDLLAHLSGEARYGESWKLQLLTDLTTLPDYDEQNMSFGFRRGIPQPGNNKGAPVDEDGNSVFHKLPDSWDAAKSDGERWRWAMQQTVEKDPTRRSAQDLEWAQFLQAEFGVKRDVVGPPEVRPQNRKQDDSAEDGELKKWMPHLLKDSETIAHLASGKQRMILPDEFNHIVVLEQVIAREDASLQNALEQMVTVRMNRHQYPQAATLLERIKKLTKGKEQKKAIQDRIDQIVKNWVEFQAVKVQPAGEAASFEIRYRNSKKITFEMRPIDITKLINDVKQYLQSNPNRVDYQEIQVENVGVMLLNGDPEKYLGPVESTWQQQLEPPDGHFDAIATVTTPANKAGAFWVTGKVRGGNSARMVIWVADMAITRKHIEAGTMHYVADAVSGAPVAAANLEFFGWRQDRVGRTQNYRVLTKRFADRTDNDGICVPRQVQQDRNYQWLAVARTNDGRLAYDGFNSVWQASSIAHLNYSPTKVYTITDRPVYRPEHTVKYRLWVRQPRFSQDDAKFANQKYTLQIRNPKGDVVQELDVTTDQWAGVDGEWKISADATLGNYSLAIGNMVQEKRTRQRNGRTEVYTTMSFRSIGQGQFRIEEYRKPEYEVTIDAPDKPVMLGEKIQAKVTANYYFGAPVTEATIHYRVERTKKDARWYPVARWDWLYSPGYWWFAPNYEWYPGWKQWGCLAPIPPWRGWQPDPPELVAEGEVPIGEDGTLLIDIDTASAKRDHSDSDHNYSITAEVVDQSRRTITGSGSVLVAREPFRVFVWPDRGHYRTGDTAEFRFQARTPDGKPVAGKGTAMLYQVTYPDSKPVEREVQQWDVNTGDDGQGTVKMVLPDSGQFRLAVKIQDTEQHTAEGAYVLFVAGPDENGRGYRFNDLELITEKRQYEPGETVKLQVNTNKANSTVLLFVRPMNGLSPAPRMLRLDGKSTIVDIDIVRDDMPNIFVEALTIADGRIHSAMREIVVPPVRKVANVEVMPSAERYRPGEEATIRLKLTDVDGKPFVGNTVLSVYDASLEYIAASSIPEIRSFFWQVRRRHNSRHDCTLEQTTGPVYQQNETRMQQLQAQNPEMVMWGMGGGMGGGFRSFSRGRSMDAEMSFAMPMAAPMSAADGAMPEAAMMKSAAPAAVAADAAGAASAEVQPTVRSSFADTAYWVASVTSDPDGIVEVRFAVPDNLTTWKVKAWTLGDGTRVGSGSSDFITSKDLIIRPQTPRFFTETDQITLSAVVHNYLETAKSTRVVLQTEGGQLQLAGDAEQVVQIPAGGEVRVDWSVHVVASGDAKVIMKAFTDEESDATEIIVPAKVHGLLKTESFTGVIRPAENSAVVSVDVPAARIEEQTKLEVHYSPTLAGAMVDALPYLIQYPYGCTEQTLNRFLPAVITQQTLKSMGVDLQAIKDKRTNLNAQQLGDAADRAARQFAANPVFDQAEMNVIIRTGVTDLSNMQLQDGGWGWFSGFGEHSSAHLTALVVHGLTIAQRNEVPVLPDVVQRGVDWLKEYQGGELAKLKEGDRHRENPEKAKRDRKFKLQADNIDAFVAWVLTEHNGHNSEMSDYLFRDREHLSVYAKALTGLVLHSGEDIDRRDLVLRNIEQFLVQDEENQTAYLRMAPSTWWYWYGSENEAMARYLQLLLKAKPDSETAPRLVKYLLNNRRHGTYWDSTRDTAIVIEAMADYLKATGEDQPNMEVEILVDGRLQKKVRITDENLFSFDNVLVLKGDAVTTGNHRIELRRSGTGPLYFNAWLTNFTKEDPITAAGLEVKVQRRFYRLERDDRNVSVQGDLGQVVNQQTAKFRRIPLESLDSVTSGELVEVELIVESKNDYEYLMLEDRKPSGFEPDDQRSGYIFEGLRAYRELRDDRVSFFLSSLARGRHSVSYRLRAEMPSQKVSALPSTIEGMYAPELVGNSEEFKLRVQDRKLAE